MHRTVHENHAISPSAIVILLGLSLITPAWREGEEEGGANASAKRISKLVMYVSYQTNRDSYRYALTSKKTTLIEYMQHNFLQILDEDLNHAIVRIAS